MVDTTQRSPAFQRAAAKLEAMKAAGTLPQPQAAPEAEGSALERNQDLTLMPSPIANMQTSIGSGMAKAVYETSDFLFGQPADGDKSAMRRDIESQDRELDNQSAVYGMSSGISQIAVGLVGAGKLLAPIKATSKVGMATKEIVKGMGAGSIVIDPHEERLSNLVESFPDLQNPVTEYLAAQPEDSEAEGRFKNALESLGADLALIGVVKAIKLLRKGDQEAAVKEIAKMEKSKAAGLAEMAAQAQEGSTGSVDDMLAGMDSAAAKATPEAPTAAVESPPQPSKIENLGTKPMLDERGQPVIPSEPPPPGTIPTQGIPDEDVAAILKSSTEDADAIKTFGSRAQAVEGGYKFAKAAKLPWQKLHQEGGSQELMERTVQVLEARYDVAKGGKVLKDSRVRDLVNEIAEQYGEDPALILGELVEAGEGAAQMVPHMEAAFRIGNKMFLEADELAAKIRNGNLSEFSGNAELATQEFSARLSLALETMASANSMVANSGRSLRRARTQFRIKPEDVKQLKSLDPKRVMEIMDKAGGDPKKVSMLLNQRWSSRVMDEMNWHLTNGLLWMWPTHLVNMTTNAYMLAARPTEKLFGSTALKLVTKDPMKRAELSSVSRQAMREYHYTIASLSDGWANAVEAFKRGDSILNPQNTEFFEAGSSRIQTQPIAWKPTNSVWDFAQNAWQAATYRNIVGLPTRALGGADEFFKTLRYRAVIQSRAAVDATDRGLTGKAFKDYVQKSLDEAIDPETGRALDAAAAREAQTVSFQQDLNYDTSFGGSIGRGLQNMRKTAPITALVLPFIKTPVNVIRYGIKLTPGLNLAQKEFRDALLGKVGQEAMAHAVGQMAMGSMFMGLAAHMAATGRFTGSGPDDYKLKQQMMASGWKPYSVVWTDDAGNTQYFQLGRFDPAATAMGLVADVVHLMQKNPDQSYDEHIMAIGVALAKNMGEKGFLLNLNSTMDALMDPEDKLPKAAGRLAGSMIPMSSLMRGHNPDPYLREARTFVDNAIRGVPGLSETLPLTLDVWGDPVERHVGVTSEQEADIVEAEHNRIMLQTDKGLQKPSYKFEDVDLRDLTLKDGKNAYQRLGELSGHLPNRKSLKAMLADEIKKESYQDLPDGDPDVKGTRLHRLATITQKYREAAKKVFIKENLEQLKPLIKARQREVRGAIIENRRQRQVGAPGVQDLLGALRPQ